MEFLTATRKLFKRAVDASWRGPVEPAGKALREASVDCKKDSLDIPILFWLKHYDSVSMFQGCLCPVLCTMFEVQVRRSIGFAPHFSNDVEGVDFPPPAGIVEVAARVMKLASRVDPLAGPCIRLVRIRPPLRSTPRCSVQLERKHQCAKP